VFDLASAKLETDKINNFVGSLQRLLSLPCSISDASLNDKRATISGVKNDISTTYADISGRASAILQAKNAVSRAEKDLDLSSSQDKNRIANQKAALNQAYARLSQARAQSSKNILTAPFSGRVSEVNVEKGELSSQTKYAFKLISDSSYQIKSKISEIDIAKIKLGNTATVTLDAYPNVEFSAAVTSIDPASKNESGVPRYGVTLTFTNYDERIKTGMTSNADIVTEKKEGSLTIPAAYIEIKSGGGIVKVKSIDTETKKEKIEDKIVKVGIRTQDGKVEILEGLTENDELIEIAKDGQVKR
jgi:RND family efflux transporter MFP subunit